MNEKIKKEYETTHDMRVIAKISERLKDCLPMILNQKFWDKKLNVADKITYIRVIGEYDAKLWTLVYTTYPELKGEDLSFGQKVIKVLGSSDPT